MSIEINVVVGIPTLSPQGAVRTRALVMLARVAGLRPIVIDNGGHYRALVMPAFCSDYVVDAYASVAASWNHVLRTELASDLPADVVLLVNDDVEVTGAGLRALALEAAASALRWRLGARGELIGAFPHAFACFAMHRTLLNAVGYFDEQFAPAYYEDTDYLRRMKLAGVGLRQIDIGLRHDKPGTTSRDLGTDWTAVSANSKRLFEAKWGTTRRPFKYPYDKEPGR